MKTITLILLCLALDTMIVCAEDFHLIQTSFSGDRLVPSGVPATNSIYVLLLPLHEGTKVHINPVVLKRFDAKEIGLIIGGAVSRGFCPVGVFCMLTPAQKWSPHQRLRYEHLRTIAKKQGSLWL